MTSPGCDYSVRVELDVQARVSKGKPPRTGLRKFIVEYDADGEPLRIKEICQLQPPQNGIYHKGFWYNNYPRTGLPERVLHAAAAKRAAQDRAADATP